MEEGLHSQSSERSPVTVRSKSSVLRVWIDDDWKDYPVNEGLLKSDVSISSWADLHGLEIFICPLTDVLAIFQRDK